MIIKIKGMKWNLMIKLCQSTDEGFNSLTIQGDKDNAEDRDRKISWNILRLINGKCIKFMYKMFIT